MVSFRDRFGIVLGSIWDCFGVKWDRVGVILETFWGHLGSFGAVPVPIRFRFHPPNRKSVPVRPARFLKPVPQVPVPKRFGFRFPVRFLGFLQIRQADPSHCEIIPLAQLRTHARTQRKRNRNRFPGSGVFPQELTTPNLRSFCTARQLQRPKSDNFP